MTTKPSDAPWADEPFQLIALPSGKPEFVNEKHTCVYGASLMAEVHNTLIRGLNAIVQQAPYVRPSTDPTLYNEKDVKDFLLYVSYWCMMVNHHHDVEESSMFPELDKFSGTPGLMDDPKHQHSLFHDGLGNLLAYAEKTQPQDYRWEGAGQMKKIIDSFSKPLMDHLYAEIDVFLSMKNLDSDGLRATLDRAETAAMKHGNFSETMYKIFPCVFGNADKTYSGGSDFPPLPRVLPYVIRYWFAAGNGAWRFNPCDFWGQPRPLAFGPG